MNIVYLGAPITVNLSVGQTIAINTTGTVAVECVSGLGLTAGATIGSIHGSATYGPFSAVGVARITATVRDGAYEVSDGQPIPIDTALAASGQTVLDDASRAVLGNSGVTALDPYTGIVASRCAVPSALAAVNKQLMSRSKHIAMDRLSSIRLVFANWYVKSSATIGENLPGASATFQAAIEYPSGTIAAVVNFGGAATGTAADGETLVSDAVAVNIPLGASFFVRTFVSSTAGILYRSGSGGLNNIVGTPVSGEAWTFGVTTPNLVNTPGPFANQQTGIYFGPTAIIGLTSKPTLFIAGDSRQNNGVSYDTTSDGFGLTGEFGRSFGVSLGALNAGCASERAQTLALTPALYAKRLALAQYCSHIVSGYGINDITGAGGSARTAAQLLADLQTIWAQFGGKPVYQSTIAPKSSSTDSWATTVNQTTDATNSERTAFNDSIRYMPPPLSGYFEVADQMESARNSGIWKAAYTSDGIHANQTAQLALAASKAVALPGVSK